MELHFRLIDPEEVNGVAHGKFEIWADDCNTDAEKALAQLVTTSVLSTTSILSTLTNELFEAPKETADQEKAE